MVSFLNPIFRMDVPGVPLDHFVSAPYFNSVLQCRAEMINTKSFQRIISEVL
jgi:hypothetical protein